MAGSLWASGPLGMGHTSLEWAKEGSESFRAIVKYSQALSKWADWGLEFSRINGREMALLGLDTYEDVPLGSSGRLLLLGGPSWKRWQWVSQWRIAPGAEEQVQWQHRLSKGGEKRKANAGELSAWRMECRASGQASNVVIQCRAQLRWALPSTLHNRYFQITAQVHQTKKPESVPIDYKPSIAEPAAQLNGSLKWGKQSVGIVLYRGSTLQWATLPSLPYQSTWKPVSGNGFCLSACCRRPMGRKAELNLQALFQSPSTTEAPLLRMFAQVQWKA
jgi:hypothetical protein